MLIIESNIQSEHAKGRWIILNGHRASTEIDEINRVVLLQTTRSSRQRKVEV